MITNSVTKTSMKNLTSALLTADLLHRAQLMPDTPLRTCATSAAKTSGSVVFSPSRFCLPVPW